MTPEPEVLETTMDKNPLLDFLLADLAWGKKPRVRVEFDPTIAADEAFAREIALAREVVYPIPADVPIPSCGDRLEPLDGRESCGCLDREVCEDAEVDALTQPVPTVALPFGKSD